MTSRAARATRPSLREAIRDLALRFAVQIIEVARHAPLVDVVEESRPSGALDRPRRAEPSRATDTLESHIEQLCSLAEQPRSDATRYAMGAITLELKTHPGRYGRDAVTAAATAMREDAPGLYRFSYVAERWTADEVAQFLRPRDGRRLQWSHLVAVARIASRSVRRRFIRRAMREGLSIRELEREIDVAGVRRHR